MEHDINKILIWWKIRCINKKTKKLFDRDLILDWRSLTPKETGGILGLINTPPNNYELLQYRKHFKEVSPKFFNEAKNHFTSMKGISLINYFEDEDGKGLDELELIRYLSGGKTPILLGNVKSLLQLGPSPIKDKENWEQKYSDTLAHFLQVNHQIAKSRWLRQECRLTNKDGKFISTVPSFESLIYVTIYFRQLYSQEDKLFRSACDTYMRFVDNEVKQEWVKHEKDCFFERLKEAPMFCAIDGIANQDLLEAFLYGALVIHSNLAAKLSKRKQFKELLESMSRDKLIFCLNACLRLLYNHVATVAPIIYRDLAHWQHNEGIPAPDIQWHERIFGGQNDQ